MPTHTTSTTSPIASGPALGPVSAGVFDTVVSLTSANPHVSKHVFSVVGASPAIAEAVLYRYPTFRERTVICCSTQSGCPVGCRFCGAGDGFVRSLTADEIVTQVSSLLIATGVEPDQIAKLQIMFMSMGEPLLNQRHLIPAIRTLRRMYPNAALLISTSGPAVSFDALIDLSVEIPNIGLQFSVHESTDAARELLIPYARKLSLAQIAEVGARWHAATGRRPFFNYCVHESNKGREDVGRLVALFDPAIWEATVSVVCERDETMEVAFARQRALTVGFMGELLEAGYSVRLFDPAGQDDVGGGCGQLWAVQRWMAEHPEKVHRSAGTGRPPVHTPLPSCEAATK